MACQREPLLGDRSSEARLGHCPVGAARAAPKVPVEVALRHHELFPAGSLSCRPELSLFDAGLEVVPSDRPGNLGHHSSEGMVTDVPRGTNRRGGDQNCSVDLLFSLLRLSILTIDSRCVDKKLNCLKKSRKVDRTFDREGMVEN